MSGADASPRLTLSVVVPCLDAAGTIRDTLRSIVDQDLPGIECIVVDGGSADGTVDVVRSFGDRVTLVSKPGFGPQEAINQGWASTKGDVVAWLNADDRWTEGAARRATEYLRDNPAVDVVYGHTSGIDDAGRTVWWGAAQPWDLRRSVLECDHIINQPSAFIRRTAATRAGPLCREWVHDHDLWIRIALDGGTLRTIDEHLAVARVGHANRGMDVRWALPQKRAMIERVLTDPRMPAAIALRRRRALSNVYLRGLHYLRPGHPADWLLGASYLARAVATDPRNTHHALGSVVKLVWRRTFPLSPPS